MPVENYHDQLVEQLKDIDEAAAYLTACLDESEEVFLTALRQVAEAHGGVGELAKSTELNREGLYRMLSKEGNPKLYSLSSVLDSFGIKITFEAA